MILQTTYFQFCSCSNWDNHHHWFHSVSLVPCCIINTTLKKLWCWTHSGGAQPWWLLYGTANFCVSQGASWFLSKTLRRYIITLSQFKNQINCHLKRIASFMPCDEVLAPIGSSKYAGPTFIILKKRSIWFWTTNSATKRKNIIFGWSVKLYWTTQGSIFKVWYWKW